MLSWLDRFWTGSLTAMTSAFLHILIRMKVMREGRRTNRSKFCLRSCVLWLVLHSLDREPFAASIGKCGRKQVIRLAAMVALMTLAGMPKGGTVVEALCYELPGKKLERRP